MTKNPPTLSASAKKKQAFFYPVLPPIVRIFDAPPAPVVYKSAAK